MGGQAIVERIISDAEQEARDIINDAEEKAAKTLAEASLRAQRNKQGVEAEVREKVTGIFDGKAATARLDCAKIALGEKRGVIDAIYSRALAQLVELNKADAVFLANRLLSAYAEDGDEIVFAENYRFVQDVSALPVVREKGLKVSPKSAKIDGGFMLCGKNSDKNLSYGALLAADREEFQADIAVSLFKV